MLKNTILKSNLTEEESLRLQSALNYEGFCMDEAVLNKTIAKCNRTLSAKNILAAKAEAARVEKAEAEASLADIATKKVALEEDWNAVIASMTAPTSEGYANTVAAVRTVLRVLLAASTRTYREFAVFTTVGDAQLYNTLSELAFAAPEEDGSFSNSDARKALYNSASDRLDAIVRATFSLPVETLYTNKVRVKLNATDRRDIYSLFVTNFSARVKKNRETGESVYDKRAYRTLIKKTGKEGEEKYDFTKFYAKLVEIIIEKYAAK